MPMFLDPFKDMMLILLNFHVVFKYEPITFTRIICDDEETFGLTRHVIYINWSQEMVPQVTVGLPSISCNLGWLFISPSVKVSRDRRYHPPEFHHVFLEGYGPHTTFNNWCARNHIIFVLQEARRIFIRSRGHRFFRSHHIIKRYPFNSNIPHKLLLQTLNGFRPIIGINHRRYRSIRVLLFALLELTQKSHAIQCYIGWYHHPSAYSSP